MDIQKALKNQKDKMSKNCVKCQSEFINKAVSSSCADCKTCPNLCDSCQLILNQKQQELANKFDHDPSNFAVSMEVKFVSIESSREYPFLIKETFEGANTGRKIESYYFWKVVDGIKLFYCPNNNTERDKQIMATTKWIDFSHNRKNDFVDLRYFDKREGTCIGCKKTGWMMSGIPLSRIITNSGSCLDCLTHMEKGMKEYFLLQEQNSLEYSSSRNALFAIREAQKFLKDSAYEYK